MTERLFVRDQVSIDGLKISEDTDPVHGPTTTFKDVVIASVIIQEYDDGKAYKPPDELKNAFWSWEGRWAIVHDHPPSGIIMALDDIHGKTVNLRFVKNLTDHKTGRPNRRGILSDLVIFNKKVPPQTLDDMKNGKKADVSIGFFFTKDATAGIIEEDGHPLKGQSYDYVQRAFMGDHTAFGLEVGRCPMPNCGIGADQLFKTKEVEGDPFAGYETFEACIKDIMKKNPTYTRKQAQGTCAVIEQRSKEKHKSDAMRDRSMEQFKSWKAELDTVLSRFDDLVEEEYQGNVTNMTKSELAMMYFSISEEIWEALSEEEKNDYINRLPPEKERVGGEEMSERDCTYEWETVREKILETDSEPIVLSRILGEMVFDDGSVSMAAETVEKLKELGVDLEPCERDDEEEIGEDEQDDYDEFIAPHLAEDAVLSYAAKKALPDSAYAYIEAGCKKEDGKTQQRCRHMPIHDESHVRAALAALGGARTGKVPPYASKAKPKVCAAAKKFKIESEVCGTKGKDLPSTEEVLKDAERVWRDKERIVG